MKFIKSYIMIALLITLITVGLSQAAEMSSLAYPARTVALPKSYTNNYELTANTNKSVTVPSGAKYAVFSFEADVYVNFGAAAAVPSGDTTDGTGSILNPQCPYVEGETTLGVISESAAKGSITFYQ